MDRLMFNAVNDLCLLIVVGCLIWAFVLAIPLIVDFQEQMRRRRIMRERKR